MGKHMVSNLAKCPFYRHEDQQVIYCDGVQDGTCVHLAFDNKKSAVEYKRDYCKSKFEDCEIFIMLDVIGVGL